MNVRTRGARLVAVVTSLAVVAGCGVASNEAATKPTAPPDVDVVVGDEPAPVSLRDEADTVDTWTWFVYLAADNNLESAAITDIEEMSETENARYLVLLDRSPGYSDADVAGLGDFEDAVLLDIQGGEIDVEQMGEPNMGDPEVLADFIETGFEKAPDGHHGLVFWNHGAAWRGIAWDDSSDGDRLEMPEMEQGIADGLERAGVEGFELVGFDACLMATYEVARVLAPYAAYLLASEELEPNGGWDWTATDTGPEGATTVDLATSTIDGYIESTEAIGVVDSTLSIVDLSGIERLDAAVAGVADAIDEDGREIVGRVGYSRGQAVAFGRSPSEFSDHWMVDLGDMARSLAVVDGMGPAAEELAAAVDDMVVHHGAGPITARSTGLAAYFPSSDLYLDERYASLAAAPAWNDLIDRYYTAAASVTDDALPTYVVEDRYILESNVDSSPELLEVSGDVVTGTGGNIVDASLLWGRVNMNDTSQVLWYGERNAVVDSDTVIGGYDWTFFILSVGGRRSFTYADERYGPEGNLLQVRVPIRYDTGGETYEGQMFVDYVDGTPHHRFFLGEDDRLSEWTPTPGDTFVPIVARQDLGSFEITWVEALPEPFEAAPDEGIVFEYVVSESAAPVMVGLVFEDVRGNIDQMYYGTASP